jgi:SPP1 family predicted phage head-tail adaptor
VYKLNRRITVRRYTTAKNDFGGLVSVQTGSWSKWAQANERFGTSSNTLQQQVWQYDQRFITRFEVERPTKSNDLIEYEGRLYRVESVGIDSEGFKAFEIIRCIRIDTNINSAAPVDNDSIQLINYTGVSNETTFTNSSLIGKTPFAAFKDGIQFVIVTGVPDVSRKEVRINAGSGLTTWSVEFAPGEIATIIFY